MKARVQLAVFVTSGFLFTQSGAVDETRVAVIVQGRDTDAVARAVRAAGGLVTHELGVIDAVGAHVTGAQRARLAASGLRFYEDAPVEATSTVTTATRTVKDQFTQVSYGNNHGTQRWANNWVEVGDDGQPWQSDHISIMDDQSNKRLRIASSGKSIWRTATIPSTSTKATLTFKYRRAHLESGDNVAVEASKDGGVSWTTVARISGGANDSSYRSATYDFSAYRSSKTSVRFRSTFLNNETYFVWPNDAVFLDDVQLEFDGFVPGTSYPALAGADKLHAAGLHGTGVAVAVIDSGHWSHPSLDNGSAGWMRVMAQYDAIRNVMLASYGAAPVNNDGSGHGTHVTSVIASSGKDASGKYLGVAPNVQLISIKAFDANGAGRYSDVIRAIGWVVAHRAEYDIRALNCSFSAAPRSLYWEDPVNQAVMRAWQSGVAVVASAGNRGPGPMTIGVPGNLPYVITVGAATDNVTRSTYTDDFLTSFSSAGPTHEAFVKPEVVAPGGHAWGLMSTAAGIAQKYPQFRNDGDYFSMSGTSQAAAVVTGLVALMHQRQWLTPDDTKCRLMAAARTATDAYGNPQYTVFQQGAGLINAEAAVYGTATGCANQGMDVALEVAGTRHYRGPAKKDGNGKYYLKSVSGRGYSWDGTYTKGSTFSWNDVYGWNETFVWGETFIWSDLYSWNDTYVWADSYGWNDSLTEAVAINHWVPQQ